MRGIARKSTVHSTHETVDSRKSAEGGRARQWLVSALDFYEIHTDKQSQDPRMGDTPGIEGRLDASGAAGGRPNN
jgi:hypothetical protein